MIEIGADAIDTGVKRATKTLKNVAGAWVTSLDLVITKGRVAEYRVRLMVTSLLAEWWPTRRYWRGSRKRNPW